MSKKLYNLIEDLVKLRLTYARLVGEKEAILDLVVDGVMQDLYNYQYEEYGEMLDGIMPYEVVEMLTGGEC